MNLNHVKFKIFDYRLTDNDGDCTQFEHCLVELWAVDDTINNDAA